MVLIILAREMSEVNGKSIIRSSNKPLSFVRNSGASTTAMSGCHCLSGLKNRPRILLNCVFLSPNLIDQAPTMLLSENVKLATSGLSIINLYFPPLKTKKPRHDVNNPFKTSIDPSSVLMTPLQVKRFLLLLPMVITLSQ